MGMTVKSIQRHLKEKVSAWIETLPKDLQSDVKKDVLVTGGSIASLLLGEKVNDYDIYFKSTQTAMKVARYYLDSYHSHGDILVVDHSLNGGEKRVEIRIPSSGHLNKDDFVDSVRILETGEKNVFVPIFISSNTITLSDKFQLVMRFIGEADEIHKNYDFIHATNVYDFSSNKLTLNEKALTSLLSKQLHYVGSKYPICSLFRLRKFINRGWTINAGQITKIAFQISNLDMRSVNVMLDQLTGVDSHYMIAFINAMESASDKHNFNEMSFDDFYNYVGALLDKIYDDDESEVEL